MSPYVGPVKVYGNVHSFSLGPLEHWAKRNACLQVKEISHSKFFVKRILFFPYSKHSAIYLRQRRINNDDFTRNNYVTNLSKTSIWVISQGERKEVLENWRMYSEWAQRYYCTNCRQSTSDRNLWVQASVKIDYRASWLYLNTSFFLEQEKAMADNPKIQQRSKTWGFLTWFDREYSKWSKAR